MGNIYAIVLAAGKGTRMKSKRCKVVHEICGKPMVGHVVDALQTLQPAKTVVVVGHGARDVEDVLATDVQYAKQENQLGTGHAVMAATPYIAGKSGDTFVVCGDTPLLRAETLEAMVHHHRHTNAALTMLTSHLDDPTGYGRVLRDASGKITRIVEQKDATESERRVNEINAGFYCFDNQKLQDALEQIDNKNAQGEYYLTDCIEVLVNNGETVEGYCTNDCDEIIGINDRVALSQAEAIMRQRINERHMRAGVTLVDPSSTYIGPDVVIGNDTHIAPGTIIEGKTTIGEDCHIGPHVHLRDAQLGQGVNVDRSVIIESTVGEHSTVGPFAYIRPHTQVGDRCRIGDFVELKKSRIGNDSKIPHLSYVGDAQIGSGVNVGCGSITVNYNGQQKERTIVEDGAFIGCNTNLVAPVTIGKGAYVAAGSTITDSIPGESLAIARQQQTVKEGYVPKLKEKWNRETNT